MIGRAAVRIAVIAAIVAIGAPSAGSVAAGVTVSGTVSGSDQGFLTGASVAIAGGERRSTKTDADGRFTFADVPKGRYQITVSAEGYLAIDRPMEVGDAPISMDIVLLRLPGLDGH
jgi:iron complex outermembrane receptor protein